MLQEGWKESITIHLGNNAAKLREWICFRYVTANTFEVGAFIEGKRRDCVSQSIRREIRDPNGHRSGSGILDELVDLHKAILAKVVVDLKWNLIVWLPIVVWAWVRP